MDLINIIKLRTGNVDYELSRVGRDSSIYPYMIKTTEYCDINKHRHIIYFVVSGISGNKYIIAACDFNLVIGRCVGIYPESIEIRRKISRDIVKYEIGENKCYLDGGMNVNALITCIFLLNQHVLVQATLDDERGNKENERKETKDRRIEAKSKRGEIKDRHREIQLGDNEYIAVILDNHVVIVFNHNNVSYVFDSLAETYAKGKFVIDSDDYKKDFLLINGIKNPTKKLIAENCGIQKNSTCFLYCLSFLDLMTSNDQNVIAKRQYILNNINNVFCNKEHNGELLVIENMLNMLCDEQKIINTKVDGNKINKTREIENNNNSTIRLGNSRYTLKINDIINESVIIKFLNKNIRDRSINIAKPAKEVKNNVKYSTHGRNGKILNRTTDGVNGYLVSTGRQQQTLQEGIWRYGMHKKRFNILHKKQYHTKKQYNLRLQRWRQRENLKYNQGKYVLYR